ncbi:hypothetical protein MASR2M15_07150 [Anaerolineales bacterium]
MSTIRIKQLLIQYTQQQAPQLLSQLQNQNDQEVFLTRGLAKQGKLILILEAHTSDIEEISAGINHWTALIGEIYQVICSQLFPSYGRIHAAYVDNHLPVVIALDGECAPVVYAMAHWIIPYLAQSKKGAASEAHLQNLNKRVLGFLEMDLTDQEAYKLLSQEINKRIRLLKQASVSTVSFLPLEEGIMSLTPPAPPEFSQGTVAPKTGPLIPLPGLKSGNSETKRQPPLPPLPESDLL